MKNMHLDSTQSVFFTRQLEEIDARLFEQKYAELEIFQLVQPKPMDPGAETYTWRKFDSRGVALMTSNYASGSPRVDVAGEETTAKVRSLRASYGYNIQEIRAAASANVPLDAMRAVAARRAINEKINSVGLLGDAQHGMEGLYALSNAQTYTVPADGTGASKLWSTKTGDLQARDMLGVIDQVASGTSEVEKASRLLMSYSRLRTAGATRLSTASDKTALQFVKEQRPEVEIRGALGLETAGSSSDQRMVAYNPDPVNLELLLPVPFETFPPQLQGMEYVVECHARMGGIVCRYPLTVAYGDGI